ncbi:MAG: hypothetical protein LUE26_01685 [Alistipes sp.]|nr:hypothetical protein [Alistipes sp.]
MDRLYKGVAGFLLTVCLVAATGHGALGQPDCTFEHYSVNDGLSQHTVSAIFQDSRDLMWFGTFNGLNSFDGHRFRHYRPVSERNPQVTNPRIDEIGEDMYGKIWVRTYDGKAYQVDRATGVFVPVLPGELHRNHTVEGLYFSPSGRVWLLTGPGIIEAVPTADIHSTAISHHHTGNSALPSDNVLTVVTDLRGRDVVVTDGGLLVCGGPDGETVFTAELPELNCCLPVEGGFLCGTGSGTILTLDERLAATAGYRVSDYPVTVIYPSGDGRYLVLTSGGGFLLWDPDGGPGRPYRRASHPALPSDEPVSAYVDSRGEAWIDMPAEGVVQFSIPTGRVRFHRPEVEKVGVYSISEWSFAWEDINGLMWVYPRGGGLSYYDRDTDRLEYFHNRPSDPARRLSNILLQCFSDRQGNLWMSTYSRGIDKVSFTGPSLPNIMPDRGSTAIAGNEVRAVYRQPSGTMWIATREGSLYTGQGGEGPFTRMGEAGRPGAAPWFDAFVYCITEDSGGNIWLGTRNKGVYRLNPDGHGGFAVTHIEHDPADPYGINSNSIYTIYEDSAGTMWFGTWGGGVNYLDTHSEGFRFINTGNHMRDYPAAGFDKVRHITGDGRGNLRVATTDGALCIRNPQAGGGTVRQIETYSLVPGGKDSPAVNDIHDILLRGDTVWLATFGGGLNRMVPAPQGGYTVTHINSENGFPADIILTLEADSAGNLWMCSETDIIKYDPATGGHELFSPLRYPDLAEASFSEGASLAGADGRIYFGHSHGIYVIDPGELPRDGFVPDIRFGRLLLYNNEVTPADEHSPLAAGLDDTPVLTLNHRQRGFHHRVFRPRFPEPPQYRILVPSRRLRPGVE